MKKTFINALALVAVFGAILVTTSCGEDEKIVTQIETRDSLVEVIVEPPFEPNFAGSFIQMDQMGRPGINTVFSPNNAFENAFNLAEPSSDMVGQFQATFQERLESFYAAYSATAETELMYENNLLGLDIGTLTTALALDVLQVAGPGNNNTTYFESGANFLTGRKLEDDVIDVSLILLFGGANGDRFDGDEGTPELVSDNVGLEEGVVVDAFPYIRRPAAN